MLFPELKTYRDSLESKYFAQQGEIEAKAKEMYAQSPADAVKFLNDYSNTQAQQMLATWKNLAVRLIVRYNDMAVKKMKDGKYLKTKYGLIEPVERPGYPMNYARKMIQLSKKNMQQPEK